MNHAKHTSELVIRRLRKADMSRISEHFLRLDAASRRARFCGTISDDNLNKYATGIFGDNSIIFGAFLGGELRGIAELRGIFQVWSEQAEAAFTVEADWQNNGIGDALFGVLYAASQNRGVKKLSLMCQRDNRRMIALAARHHATLQPSGDSVDAVFHPYWPTPVSVSKELIGEVRSFAQVFATWPAESLYAKMLKRMPRTGQLSKS